MVKEIKNNINAKGIGIRIISSDSEDDYICLTDLAKYKNSDEPRFIIQNWLRNRNTLEYIGLWEILNNKDFNRVQFDTVRQESGLNRFTMTPQKWVQLTNATGIFSKSGKYGGGTYAHYDIAMEFASWISPEFKLYIVKDYKRLKANEHSQQSLEWNLYREIAKLNYKLHTEAIKDTITQDLTPEQLSQQYATESDLLNVALFNQTAKQWKEKNPTLKGNMRDYANLNELLVLSNMESYNSILIRNGISQKNRLIELRTAARRQLLSLNQWSSISHSNYQLE